MSQADQSAPSDPGPKVPQLLFLSTREQTADKANAMVNAVAEILAGKSAVVDYGVITFQLVNGKFEPLIPFDAPAGDAPKAGA